MRGRWRILRENRKTEGKMGERIRCVRGKWGNGDTENERN